MRLPTRLLVAAATLALFAGQALAQTQASLVSGAITTPMTGTASVQLLAPPADSSQRNYVTGIFCSNTSATATEIAVQDGSGGPTLLTIPAAASYAGNPQAAMPFYPLRQPTPGAGLYVANLTTSSSTKCSAVGYKAQ